MKCQHSITERDNASEVDGLCAYCLCDENAELKRRIRLARKELMRNWRHGGGSMCSREVADRLPLLLDLRKPLPKSRRR